MDNNQNDISGEDLRAALREVKTYVDITEEDLKKIYEIALRHAKERLALKVSVSNVMTKNVITISKTTDYHEAAKLLSENRISGMPVIDDSSRVLGVISEADILSLAGMNRSHTFRDILQRVLGEPLPRQKRGDTVGDVMTSPAETISPDADIRDAAKVLNEKRIKRLPVVDGEGRLIGIIARADIVRAIGKK